MTDLDRLLAAGDALAKLLDEIMVWDSLDHDESMRAIKRLEEWRAIAREVKESSDER